MNNLMSNFSGLALSRMEMKKVTGGCMIISGSTGKVGGPYKDANSASKAAGAGGHYCCTGCASASWLQ